MTYNPITGKNLDLKIRLKRPKIAILDIYLQVQCIESLHTKNCDDWVKIEKMGGISKIVVKWPNFFSKFSI